MALARRCNRLISIFLAAVLMLPPAGAASLGWSAPASPTPTLQLASNDALSLDKATRRIQRQTGGRVLSAREVRRNGRRWYEIRVLVSEGKVRVFRVDPQSGRTR